MDPSPLTAMLAEHGVVLAKPMAVLRRELPARLPQLLLRDAK